MGDRGNIVIRTAKDRQVFLYGHWSGHDMPGIAQRALQKHWRWDDPSYLARIVFDVLSEGQVGKETGLGIGTTRCDWEHPDVVIDTEAQSVYYRHPESDATLSHKGTFEEFCALTEGDMLKGYELSS